VLYYLAYAPLLADEGMIFLYAGLDGINWSEGWNFIRRWNDFFVEWSPPFPDRPGQIPHRVRMLWHAHALSEGFGAVDPK
jgi:hypothetical protein